MFYYIFLLIFYIKCCNAVVYDTKIDDVKEIKSSAAAIVEQLQNWHNLYLNQVEPKLSSSTITITNIDNNVKNLQERAHVWDTFQLHVTAWNEQLASIDRKLDIILTGQEKAINNSDTKLYFLNHLDYKIDSISKNLSTATNLTANNNQLLIETLRGILDSLKQFDQRISNCTTRRFEEKSLPIKCQNTQKLEAIVNDISSKVDVIFDAISNDKKIVDDKNSVVDEEYVDDQENDEESDDNESDFDVKLFKLILSRINRPCRQTNNVLKTINNKLSAIESNIATNMEYYTSSSNSPNDQTCNFQEIESTLNKWSQEIKMQIYNNLNTFNDVIKDHLNKQQIYLENSVRNFETACSSNAYVTPTNQGDINNLQVIFSDKTSCKELNEYQSGVYKFQENADITTNENFFTRYCEIKAEDKWTVIQVRGIQSVPQNFHMNWQQYKNGFGKLNGDFWFGNDFIHLLTRDGNQMLRVELESFDGRTAWAEYETFIVDSENNNYKLTIGHYKGNASDSFSSHNNSLFSTYDKKNDLAPECCPCAVSYGGGWWFNSCFECNLNGNYNKHPTPNNYQGIIWEHWLGNASLKKTKMMIKTKTSSFSTEKPFSEVTFASNRVNVTLNVTEIPFYEDP